MSSYYNIERAGLCHDIPCWVSGFDVTIDDVVGGISITLTGDTCNQVTDCKMLSSVLRAALNTYLTANSLEKVCGCCRDGEGLSFNLAGKYAQWISAEGVLAQPGIATVVSVTPPFAAG